MAVKLSELYECVKHMEITLVAGKKGLTNIVRWVHMVENEEISSFLEGQEVAFTTGIGLEKEQDLFSLVKQNYQNQASGMVINIGPYIKNISQEIYEFCDKHDFPLFQVPWHVHMAEIMRVFCFAITESEKINMELSSAVKNAIFFQDQENLYVPQLERHGFHVGWSYCLALIELKKSDQDTVTEKVLREKLLQRIDSLLTHSYKRTFVFEAEGRLLLVFAKYQETKVKSILEDIVKSSLPLLSKKNALFIGIGQSTKNIKCIAKSYRKAMSVLTLQKKKDNKNEVVLYRELGLYKLLLSIEDKEVVKEYHQETIGPLIQYDELNGSDYVQVLECYLKCSGSVKEVSERLYVHRNTINYKLNKIEEVLGCDLSDLNTRLVLSIALMVKEIF